VISGGTRRFDNGGWVIGVSASGSGGLFQNKQFLLNENLLYNNKLMNHYITCFVNFKKNIFYVSLCPKLLIFFNYKNL